MYDRLVGRRRRFDARSAQSLGHLDPAARWQIAVILPGALGDRAAEPLRRFARNDDECVRRRASAALSKVDGAVR